MNKPQDAFRDCLVLAAEVVTAADANKARTLRADGAKLCSQGKSAEGVKKLDEAIKMLGVRN